MIIMCLQMNANKNGYQGGGGGGGGGDFNYNQHSSIQHPSQIYPNQRNYGQNQQQYGGYGQGIRKSFLSTCIKH